MKNECKHAQYAFLLSKKMLLVFVFWFLALGSYIAVHAQTTEYRSVENKLYWKNKQPRSGYWQQDVHYNIKAVIDETTDIIAGEETLKYYNNSPDTLSFLFFHLYQNAFQPGSYLHDLHCANKVKPVYGKYETSRQGTVIEQLRVTSYELQEGNLIATNNSQLNTELDNTILKVYLPKPLAPNDSVVLNINFRTFYDNGSVRRRMKLYRSGGFKHYNGCQWYPKVCVYDAHSGWNTDQHLNREFYGNFGTFEVDLTFASNYVVEATGILLNENEVLPDTLKAKLQIGNFKDKPWGERTSIITPYKKGQTKTWKYRAINVHDFAFTADPNYRIADTTITLSNGNKVSCIAIADESHCSGWTTAAQYCAKIIGCFSRDFGNYEYPKMVVADAADGMEYPMITLDGGRDPGYRGLLVHEVGHNWFYGMLGNNETYRAMMDEGFTQFLTAWGMEHIDNTDTVINERHKIKNRYLRKFTEPQNIRDSKVYLSFLMDAVRHSDEPLNTHSDHFHGALGQGGGYRHVYAKTSAMLYNLQYVLGDSLFLAAMQHYVNTWKIAHPYPEDFRHTIIRFTKQDLNWFFDQWMESTKNIDYAIKKVRKGDVKGEYKITFERKGRMQMPIDFRVVGKDGSVQDFYIPNTWFEKSNELQVSSNENLLATRNSQLVTLQRWIGWDKLRPTYTATVKVPSGIKNVIIDPSERLADINMLNNRLRNKVELRFDSRIFPLTSWKKYRIWMRPDVWWNALDGFKIGMHVHGNYMNVKHNFSLTVWANTRLGAPAHYNFSAEVRSSASWVSYRFTYQNATDKFIKGSTFHYESRLLDGYELYKAGMSFNLPKNIFFDVSYKAFSRPRNVYRNYLLYPNEWSTFFENGRQFNNTINASVLFSYAKPNANGWLKIAVRSTAFMSNWDYHYAEVEHRNTVSFWRFDLRSRAYFRFGSGSKLPDESALYMAQANGEEMMENKYVRAVGQLPQNWVNNFGNTTNHFHHSGGLNLRGYSGYLAAETDKYGNTVFAYKGSSGGSVNAELDFNRIITFKKNKLREWMGFNTYLFADAGMIVYNNSRNEKQFSKLRADAGVGAAFTIKKWGVLQGVKPLTLRFDMPFYLSHAPFDEGENVKFRFLVGVSRAF